MAHNPKIDTAMQAGLIIVVSIFMAFIVYTFGDLLQLGTWESTTNDTVVDQEPDNLTNWEYSEGAGDQMVDIMPVIVLILGLLASFLMLRDLAQSEQNGGF